MKHLSLLAVLQAACLAVGLTVHADGLSDQAAVSIVPFLLTFSWITLIQGGLGYFIFSRLYRKYQIQQSTIAEQLESQRTALSRTRDAVVLGLTRMAESRDDDTEGHLERVGMLAGRLAEAARRRQECRKAITPEFVRLIRFSATLHDIGKVGIEDSILQKPGSLTADERKRMQRHTRISSACLQEIETCLGDANFLQMAHEIALCHHERWDGTGYPVGISGEQIPLAARIVAIVDVYDALAAKRPYKEPYDHERCVAIITAGKGSQFDPRLIEVFLEIQDEFRKLADRGDADTETVETVEEPGKLVLTPVGGLSAHTMPVRELERILAEVDVALIPAANETETGA
jgi:HD-GYP domain-containing protein (c-di-GMP phosphodiesterase class II)